MDKCVCSVGIVGGGNKDWKAWTSWWPVIKTLEFIPKVWYISLIWAYTLIQNTREFAKKTGEPEIDWKILIFSNDEEIQRDKEKNCHI